MATIRRIGRVRHLSTTPTRHVVHLSRGSMRHSGVGLSFWFDPWTSVVSEVPVDDRELSLVVRARTADLQDVTAQVTVSYRFSEPTDVVRRIDFAVDPDTGSWTGDPLEQVAQLLGELASGHVMDAMAALTLREAVSSGGRSLREAIAAGLASDQRLASSGISVLGARVRRVRGGRRHGAGPADPGPRGGPDRGRPVHVRASGVGRRPRAGHRRERAGQPDRARRARAAPGQPGGRQRPYPRRGGRRRRDDRGERRPAALPPAHRGQRPRIREVGEAEAAAEAAKVAVYAEVERSVLPAMVARELAGALPEISNLTITPDLLTGALRGTGRRNVRPAVSSAPQRAVVVHRRTELESLLERHGTRGQAEFFLTGRGRTLAEVQDRHDRRAAGAARGPCRRYRPSGGSATPSGTTCTASASNPTTYAWSSARTASSPTSPSTSTANPSSASTRNRGTARALVGHHDVGLAELLTGAAAGTAPVQPRVMVRAVLDDGQQLDALNEVYLGDHGHQSARYRVLPPGGEQGERQSSSGLIVATGTGSTGWAASLARQCTPPPPLPGPTQEWLSWFVREAWPSPTTGTTQVRGTLGPDDELTVVVESDALVVFGDGLETDRLTATWGQQVSLAVSPRTLLLVDPASGGPCEPARQTACNLTA